MVLDVLAGEPDVDIHWVVTGAQRPTPDASQRDEILKLQGQVELLTKERDAALDKARAAENTQLVDAVSEKLDQCEKRIADNLGARI